MHRVSAPVLRWKGISRVMTILRRRVPWMSASTVAARRAKARSAQHHRSLQVRGPTVPTDRLPEQDISAGTTLELPGREKLCGTFQRPLFHRSLVTRWTRLRHVQFFLGVGTPWGRKRQDGWTTTYKGKQGIDC